MLRETREQRGLDLVTVHDRLGRPITQLEGLESGDLRSMPDQAMALSTLRRYAAFLTLDGDALALQLMEAWSTAPAANGRRRLRDNGGLTGVVAAVTSGPEHLRAFTQTGQVPRVAGFATSTAGAGSGAYGYGVAVGPPTGMIPAIAASEFKDAKRAMARARRRRRAATPLKVTTWVAAVLVLLVVAGTVIQSSQPQWFVESHLLRVTGPGGTAPPAAHTPIAAPAHPRTDPVVETTTDGATFGQFTVASQHFTVKLAASDVCWVQVIDESSATPLLQGDLQGGQEQSFDATKSITVEVGSAAVVVGVLINGKAAFLNTPANTPFTYTFTSKA